MARLRCCFCRTLPLFPSVLEHKGKAVGFCASVCKPHLYNFPRCSGSSLSGTKALAELSHQPPNRRENMSVWSGATLASPPPSLNSNQVHHASAVTDRHRSYLEILPIARALSTPTFISSPGEQHMARDVQDMRPGGGRAGRALLVYCYL